MATGGKRGWRRALGSTLLAAALWAALPAPSPAQLPPPVGDAVDGVVDQLPPPVAGPVEDVLDQLPPVPVPAPVPDRRPAAEPDADRHRGAEARGDRRAGPRRPPRARRRAGKRAGRRGPSCGPPAAAAPASRPARRSAPPAAAPAPTQLVADRGRRDAEPASSPAARRRPVAARPPSFASRVTGQAGDIVRAIPSAILWALGGISAIAIGLALNAYWQSRRRVALEAQRAELLDDIGLLSRALLPAMPEGLGVAVSAAYRPADGPAAGGDFYDVFAIGDERVGVLLGDVSGHGRESVTQAALARYTLRTLLAAGDPPGEALARADVLLARDLRPNFVTVIAGVYDAQTGELTYAKAGHAPPIVLGADYDPDAEEPAPPIGHRRLASTGRSTGSGSARGCRCACSPTGCRTRRWARSGSAATPSRGCSRRRRRPTPACCSKPSRVPRPASATTPPRSCSAAAVHKSVRARCCHRGVDLHDDGWAILSKPPGRRDLGEHELWQRSLARSRRRRDYAALQRTPVYRKKRALVSAALLTATVLAPTHDAAKAQGTAVTSTGEMLRIGSRGPAVAELQRLLGVSADGVFGRQTRRAVRSYQAAHGLEVDGIAGPITRGALRGGGGGGASQRLPASTTIAVQRALGIGADGVFGRQTRRAVRAFQASHGLEVDGVVGPQTLGALGISGAAAPVPGGGGGGSAVAAARTKLGRRTRSAASARRRGTARASPSGRSRRRA